ncbi:MAG: hypothetical protein R3F61_38695 [Myxococcota bacterium]
MLRVRHQLTTFEGVVNATFVCPACEHHAGVLTQVTGTGASSAILLHDLAQKESQENAEQRALHLAELFAKSLACPACAHRPRSPLTVLLASAVGAWVGLLYAATWELRALYRRMKDPPEGTYAFTEPPPPRPREPTAWDLWRGVR